MIINAKVVYLISGNLDTLMLYKTCCLAMLLPILLHILLCMLLSFCLIAYAAAYAFVTLILLLMLLPMYLLLRRLSSRLQQAPVSSSILADVVWSSVPGTSNIVLADA